MEGIFPILGAQLRNWRHRRRFTQPQLAERLGRDRARISELERDLAGERWGRDRLTLFAEACEALDVVPVLVPRGQAKKIQAKIGAQGGHSPSQPVHSAFDDLFVDLDYGDRKSQRLNS